MEKKIPLLLDLAEALNKNPSVCDVDVKIAEPKDKNDLLAWEQMYMCILPPEMKNFYLVCDGFSVRWKYRTEEGVKIPLGNLTINPLDQIRKVGGFINNTSEIPTVIDIENDTEYDQTIGFPTPTLNKSCKLFEIDNSQKESKVCLVFYAQPEKSQELQNFAVWYLDRTLTWHFLAPNFSSYYLLLLSHLGLPKWQDLLTPYGLPEHIQQWYGQFIGRTHFFHDGFCTRSGLVGHTVKPVNSNNVDFAKLFNAS